MSEVRDAIYNAACKGHGKISGRGKKAVPSQYRADLIEKYLKDVLIELPEGITAGEILEGLADD